MEALRYLKLELLEALFFSKHGHTLRKDCHGNWAVSHASVACLWHTHHSGWVTGGADGTRQDRGSFLPFDLQFPVLFQILLAGVPDFGNSLWTQMMDSGKMVLKLRKTEIYGLFWASEVEGQEAFPREPLWAWVGPSLWASPGYSALNHKDRLSSHGF